MDAFVRNIVLFLSLCFLASCQTAQSDGPTPGDTVSQYNLSNLTLNVSDEYNASLFSLKEDKIALLRDGLQEQIKANLSASLPTKMTGPRPATVKVLLTQLNVASAGGKALLGQESLIRGTVSIIDDESQSLILTKQITGVDGTVKVGQGGNILIGLAVAVVVNTATSSDNTRIRNIAKSFDANTNRWLFQKKK